MCTREQRRGCFTVTYPNTWFIVDCLSFDFETERRPGQSIICLTLIQTFGLDLAAIPVISGTRYQPVGGETTR